MEIVIDVTGFEKHCEEFIVKELCAINVFDDIISRGAYECKYYLFKPPYDNPNEGFVIETIDHRGFKHGLSWDSGVTSYDLIKIILKNLSDNARTIYVHGSWKARWFNQMMSDPCPPIINIENLRLYSIDAVNHYPTFRCPNRCNHLLTSNYACAYESTQRFKQWIMEFWGTGASYEKSIEIFYNLKYLIKMHDIDLACLDEKFLLRDAPKQIKDT